jgi:hypothetical protein
MERVSWFVDLLQVHDEDFDGGVDELVIPGD